MSRGAVRLLALAITYTAPCMSFAGEPRPFVSWEEVPEQEVSGATIQAVRSYLATGSVVHTASVMLSDSLEPGDAVKAEWIRVEGVVVVSLKGVRQTIALNLFFDPLSQWLLVACTDPLGRWISLPPDASPRRDPRTLLTGEGWKIEPLDGFPESTVEDVMAYVWSHAGMRPGFAGQIAVRPRAVSGGYPMTGGSDGRPVPVWPNREIRWLAQSDGGRLRTALSYRSGQIAVVRDKEPRDGVSKTY